jgi:uncharacterized protein (DUF427 family)
MSTAGSIAGMAVSMMKQMMAALPQLRYQPTSKRVQIRLADAVVADTTRAVLIWEPWRIVPSYAVPEADFTASLRPVPQQAEPEYRTVGFGEDPARLLDPTVPFAVHTADGESLTVQTASGTRAGAGFRLHDADLAGYVELDFGAFDWWEEDEPIVGHPRDPFHRIDIRQSSRRVRLEHQGVVLADSDRGRWLFEGTFPMVRYYLPPDDVRVELRPSDLHTTCAYKGHATHYTAVLADQELANVAWSYPQPLPDAAEIAGLVCFYQERLDLLIDGQPVERVRTPWS